MTNDIIERLNAESAINRLLATYVHLLDEGRFPEIAELLKDAEFDVLGNVASGREQIEVFLDVGVQRHSDGTPRTWHSLSNILIDVDPSGPERLPPATTRSFSSSTAFRFSQSSRASITTNSNGMTVGGASRGGPYRQT